MELKDTLVTGGAVLAVGTSSFVGAMLLLIRLMMDLLRDRMLLLKES